MKLSEVVESREVKISELKFLDLLKDSARNSHNLAKKSPLFKTFKSSADYLLLNPTVSTKRPKFFIESLIADLPSWSRYPGRNTSTVAYSSRELANDRGDGSLYVVIPFDRVRLAVTSDVTFTRSFKRAANSLQLPKLDNEGLIGWLDSIAKVCKELKLNVAYQEPSTYKEVKSILASFEQISNKHVKAAKELPDADLGTQRFIEVASRNGSIMSYLNELFDPENNDYSLMTPESSFIPTNREVWVGGKAIAIKQARYQELHDTGNIK